MVRAPCLDPKTKIDCPKRKVHCRKDCPEWQEYTAKKEKEYAERTIESKRRSVEMSHTLRSIIKAERRMNNR